MIPLQQQRRRRRATCRALFFPDLFLSLARAPRAVPIFHSISRVLYYSLFHLKPVFYLTRARRVLARFLLLPFFSPEPRIYVSLCVPSYSYVCVCILSEPIAIFSISPFDYFTLFFPSEVAHFHISRTRAISSLCRVSPRALYPAGV